MFIHKGLLSKSKPIEKFFFSLFIIVVSFLFIFLAGAVLAIPFFKVNIFQNPYAISNISAESINVLKYFQVVQTIGLFILPAFIMAFCFDTKVAKYLKINISPKQMSVILAALVMITAVPIINFLAEINSRLILPDFLSSFEEWMKKSELNAQKITEAFMSTTTTAGLFINLFVIAIIPAIGEELLFRGVFQKIFINMTKNVHWGVIIAAILFSAMHMQFYGFIPRMIMGVFLGYLLVWSKTIWLPIIAHFVNNSFAVIYYFFANKNDVSKEIDNVGKNIDTMVYLIFSILIVTYLVFVIYKQETSHKELRINN
ncbi:MAG: CPBP family intramembrane metalloprotease [Bacteroidetes bacterium]|nr:CPBP family intramembrane metalloprotease [Bacteroidota bacterium]